MANLTVNDILTDAYEEAYATPEYKASNTLGLRHLHSITQVFWNLVVTRRKARNNWDIWTADTVALQDEYSNTVTSTTIGAAHIEVLAVAYSSSTYTQTGNLKYTPCRPATAEQISDWNYYLENQSNLDPIYFERDGSVFIAPEPRTSEAWVARLQIKGVRSIASGSWTTATTEQAMKLPIFTHDVIKLGLVWKIHAWHARDRAIIIDAKNEYEKEQANALDRMFVENPFEAQYPHNIGAHLTWE